MKIFSIADSPYFSPHIFSGKVVLYNPKLIKNAPKGIDALWDPKNQGKVGIVDIQHIYTTMAAASSPAARPATSTRPRRRSST